MTDTSCTSSIEYVYSVPSVCVAYTSDDLVPEPLHSFTLVTS